MKEEDDIFFFFNQTVVVQSALYKLDVSQVSNVGHGSFVMFD